MTPQEQTDIETLTTEIAAGLRSWNQKRHEEAERTLKSLGPQGIDVLLRILKIEEAALEKRKKHYYWILLGSGAALWFIAYNLLVIYRIWPPFGYHVHLPIVFFGSLNLMRSPSRRHLRVRTLLSQYDDIRVVPILLEQLSAENDYARTALTTILPRLRTSDVPILSRLHREKLYWELQPDRWSFDPYPKPEFTLAVLQALEQVGDVDAIPAVQTVIDKAENSTLIEAARECLKYLYAHAEERTTAQSLLRPSSAHGETKDMLLRPVQTNMDTTPAELLLRPRDE